MVRSNVRSTLRLRAAAARGTLGAAFVLVLACGGLLGGPALTEAQQGAEARSGPAAGAEEATLYQRIGGYDAIAATIDDFLGRFGTDPELAPYLGGLNAAAGARIRQHLVDFFCAETGGPCLYRGQDMKATHEGLGITEDAFDQVVRHFLDAFQAQGVGDRERGELRRLLNGLRGDVVGG